MSTALRRYYRGHNLVTMRDVQANASRHYHFDHQGTTQCLTNGAATVTDTFAADAWGVEVKRTGATVNPYWYIGGRGYSRHTDHRSQYVRMRWLAPTAAGWLTVDPIVTPGQTSYESIPLYSDIWLKAFAPRAALSLSPYAYADNRPVAYTDPSGMYCCTEWINTRCKDDACGWAKEVNLAGSDAAGVVCCAGSKFICVWAPTQEPGVSRCMRAHERIHFPDVTCPAGCLPSRPPVPFWKDPQGQECHAHNQTLLCLSDSIRDCAERATQPERIQCMNEHASWMRTSCQGMKENCKPHNVVRSDICKSLGVVV